MLARVATAQLLNLRRSAAAILLAASTAAGAACPPPQAPREQLRELAARHWFLADDAARQSLALALLPCLGAPDPVLRDEWAFTALSTWVRAKALDAGTLRQIGERALTMMQAPDPLGFAPPFAALTLAEVARADRLHAVWSAPQRQVVVVAAAKFLRETRDYPGFDDSEGWRHAVAHGADLLMQLSLNPMLDRSQLDLPAAQAPARQNSLADVHNAKAFVWPLYATLQESGDAELRARLLRGVTAALRRLP